MPAELARTTETRLVILFTDNFTDNMVLAPVKRACRQAGSVRGR